MKEFTLQEQGVHNRDFVNYQVQILITKLFKNNLELLEHFRVENKIPQEKFDEARKRILDTGNDSIRDIHNLLDVFNFYIDPDRLKAARENRRIVKKVVVCGAAELK